MKIAVIGLGKIGLPLAAQFANKGHDVTGVDINAQAVAFINAGQEPFPGEAGLADYLSRLVPAGKLRATTDYREALPEADAVVVAVPLFVDDHGRPDFGWMDAATADIAINLTQETLVIYETTLPVGTSRTRWKPKLEEGSGLIEGRDFHVVFSPERVLTGRVFEDLRKYPKLLGGLSDEGARKAVSFYEQVLDFDERSDLERGNGVWDLGSAEAAEMAKLAETTYRDVNIALANQFATFAESVDIDVYQVIQAANSQPYSHIHRPGVSVGGHCIPIYPQLYLVNDPEATVVRAARDVNSGMPEAAVARLTRAFGDLDGLAVLILGVAYRGNVKESAFSGAFDIRDALVRRGAEVSLHDPLYTDDELRALGFEPYDVDRLLDVVVLHTDHPEYATITEKSFPGVRVIYDGRNLIEQNPNTDVPLITLGRGDRAARPVNE